MPACKYTALFVQSVWTGYLDSQQSTTDGTVNYVQVEVKRYIARCICAYDSNGMANSESVGWFRNTEPLEVARQSKGKP